MLTQMTLLFEPINFAEKKQNSLIGDPSVRMSENEVLFNLCEHVLRIYNKFIFKAYSYLSSDHWEYIIKLLLGLASHILNGIPALNNKSKMDFPEKQAVSIIELVYNSWILSGLQNDEIWKLFKDHINKLLNCHHGIISYWSDICHELTAKILINSNCFDPPELIIQKSKVNKIRCTNSQDLLIIKHNFLSKKDSQSGINPSLFIQPFIFDLPQNQVQYLWSKFITMINQINQNMTTSLKKSISTQVPSDPRTSFNKNILIPTPIHPRTSLLISKTIRKVIELFLKQGAHSKPQDETFVFSELEECIYEYNIENKRKIIIEHNSLHFKDLLDQINPNFEQIHQEETLHEEDSHWRVIHGERPSKESLFKLFGKILFENTTDARLEYKDTRLDAICTLCLIFSRAKGSFYKETLYRFSQIYSSYLQSIKSWECFETLLECSTELFSAGHLPKIISLQKPLMEKLLQFYKMPKGDKTFQGKAILRKSCNKFCSSLLYLTDDNSQTKFSELLKLVFLKDFEELSLAPNEINNLGRSSWNLMTFSILKNRILTFVNKVFIELEWLKESSSLKLNELGIQILLVLGEMTLGRLDQFEAGWNEMCEDILESGRIIIDIIIRQFIEVRIKELEMSKSNSKKSKNSLPEELIKNLIFKSFGILYIWFCILAKLKEADKDSEKTLVFSIHSQQFLSTLQIYQNTEPFSRSIKGLISCILNLFRGSNFSKNVHLNSSVVLNNNNQQTLDECIKKFEDKCLLTIGINKETILSFYDPETEQNNQGFLVVARNSTGRFVWFGELKSKLIGHEETILEEPLEITRNNPSIYQENILLHASNPHNIQFNDEEEEDLTDELLIQQQIDMEEEYEEMHNNSNNQEEEKEDIPQERPSKMSAIRMFLSNAEILPRSIWNNLTYIPIDNHSKEKLKKIDQTLVKRQIFSSIFHVQDPSSEKLGEFPKADTLFQKFLDNLGVIISDQAMQFGSHEILKGKPILYASNPLYEFIFSLPNFSASKFNNSLELLETPPITVIWNAEEFAPYESPSYPRIINRLNLKENNVAIIISPVDEDNYSLNILKEETDLRLFPPVDSFVCPAKILVCVVSQAIISLNQEYQLQADHFEDMFEKIFSREDDILNLIQYYKRQEDNFGELLKALLK